MNKPLPKRLRAKWDALIETEGKRLGLEDCRPFLENKMVNDIFYEGTFKGRPCIVKCSSKDPESILNEYEILHRLFTSEPKYFPEPFIYFTTSDSKMAFIAMEKVMSCQPKNPKTAVDDILAIAIVLNRCGIVHRDIFRDNIFFNHDGHMKLIDFQLAINRNNPHISKWLRQQWKYHFIIFARKSNQPSATWNDVSAMRCLISKEFSSAVNAIKIDTLLKEFEDKAEFTLPFPAVKIPALLLYIASLWIQSHFCRRECRQNLIKKRLKIAITLINHAIGKSILNKEKKDHRE